MSEAPIPCYIEAGLKIYGDVSGGQCESITTHPTLMREPEPGRPRETRIKATLLFHSRPPFTISNASNAGIGVVFGDAEALRTTKSLYLDFRSDRSRLPDVACAMSYDDVLTMLKYLPELQELSIHYDHSLTKYALEHVGLPTVLTGGYTPDDLPKGLRTYEVGALFPGCQLPILASERSLQKLTICPGAVCPSMSEQDVEAFIRGFRQVLPGLTSLTMTSRRPRLGRVNPEDHHLQDLATESALTILSDAHFVRNLQVLKLEGDKFTWPSKIYKLLDACFSRKLCTLLIRPTLAELGYEATIDQWDPHGLNKLLEFLENSASKCLQSVSVIVQHQEPDVMPEDNNKALKDLKEKFERWVLSKGLVQVNSVWSYLRDS